MARITKKSRLRISPIRQKESNAAFAGFLKGVAAASFSSLASAAIAATAPIAAYNLNDAGTTAIDQSGNNNSGTLINGPAWTAGRYGGGLAFDGNDDYVSIGDIAEGDSLHSFTISTWVKFQTSGGASSETHLIDKSECSGYPDGGPFELGVTLTEPHKAEVVLYPQNGSPYNYTLSGASITSVDDGLWHFVTGRYDGAELSIWVDGVQESSSFAPGLTTSNSGHRLELGGRCNGYAYPFRGALDDVRIYDRALSASEIQNDMSTPVGGSTPPPTADTTAPIVSIAAPSRNAQVSGPISIVASATDDIGLIGVRFLVDGSPIDIEDTTAPYSISWNTASASNGVHTLSAVARDAAGNQGTASEVTVTVESVLAPPPPPLPPVDSTVPTITILAPSQNAQVSGPISIAASATDDIGVVGVRFVLDGSPIDIEDTTAPYSISWNSAATSNGVHTLSAIARDAAGKQGTAPEVNVTVRNDSGPPSSPADLHATNITVNSASLTWNASFDDVGVTAYEVFRNNMVVGTTALTTFTDSGLAADTTYAYSVRAFDAAGNASSPSSSILIATAAEPLGDTPPSTPGELHTISATTSQIVIGWAPSYDDFGVVGYHVYRNGYYIGATGTTSYIDGNLAPDTTYTYRVDAYDAAGHTSTSSSPLLARTGANSMSSYSTNFDFAEFPMSEGGRWHRADNRFTDVRISNGIAHGTNGARDTYDDSYGLLSGFEPNHTLEATIYRSYELDTNVAHEVELLLRFADNPDGARGYEVLFTFWGAIQIVRWNGGVDDYTVLDGSGGPGGTGREFETGDVVKATISGDTIRVYINGEFMTEATDSMFTEGQPGVSFFTRPGGNGEHFGFTNVTVSNE